MTRIEEIEKRLSDISKELDGEGADLDALEAEINALTAERKEITDAAEKRKQLRQSVAMGGGETRKTFEEGSPVEKRFTVDSPEYRSAWLRNLQGKELDAEERAAITASAAIPTQTMDKIVATMELYPIMAAIDTTFIPGYVTYAVEDTINAANWVAMGTAATDSSDTLKAVTLGAYKLIKTVEVTADVSVMGIDAFEGWLVDRLANKIFVAAASAVFSGDGSNKATGILHSGQVTNTGTWTADGMTYEDLMSIIAALPTQYTPMATFVMPRAVFFGQLIGMADTAGKPVVVADVQSPAKYNILGFPVIVDDNCAADTIIFGNLKEGYKFNFAQSPVVSADESVAFRAGSTVYRAMALCDGKVADKNALCVFTKGV